MKDACIYFDTFRHGDGPCWVARLDGSEYILDINNPMASERDLWLCARELGAPPNLPVLGRPKDLDTLRSLAIVLYQWAESYLWDDPAKAKAVHDMADIIYDQYEALRHTSEKD